MISDAGENLAFLLSLPRSGSTLVSLVLGGHSEVHCPPEPWFLLRLAGLTGPGYIDSLFDDELATRGTSEFLDDAALADGARAFARAAYDVRLKEHGKSVFVDKTPRYYHVLPFLDALFPKAKKIWLKRHPLDVAASFQTTWKIPARTLAGEGRQAATWDFAHGLFVLRDYFADDSADRLALSYEELVAEPDEVVPRLCEHLGLDFESSMLAFAKNDATLELHRQGSMGDKAALETDSVHGKSVGRWKKDLDKEDVRALVELLGVEVFDAMGYGSIRDELAELGISAPDEEAAARRRAAATEVRPDKISELRYHLQASETDRTARLELLNERGGEIKALRKQLDQRHGEFEAVQKQLAEVHATARDLTKQLETAKANEVSLEKSLDAAHGATRAAQERIETLEASEEELRTWVNRLYEDGFAWLVAVNSAPPQRLLFEEPAEPNLVSTIIPAYNAEPFLQRTIESVWAQHQNEGKVEILVCEDGSKDGTRALAESLAERSPMPMRVLSHPGGSNRGVSATRNLGLRHARGTFVALLDADDLWHPNKTDVQLAHFREHPEVQCLCSLGRNRDLEGNPVQGWNGSEIAGDYRHVPPPNDYSAPYDFEQLVKGDPIVNSTIMARRTALEEVGGYPEVMAHQAEDWLLLAKLALLAPIPLLDETLIDYTVHPDSYTTRYFVEGLGYGVQMEFLFYLLHWMLLRPKYRDLAAWVYRKHYPRIFAGGAPAARFLEEFRKAVTEREPTAEDLNEHLARLQQELGDLREYHARMERTVGRLRDVPGMRTAFQALKRIKDNVRPG